MFRLVNLKWWGNWLLSEILCWSSFLPKHVWPWWKMLQNVAHHPCALQFSHFPNFFCPTMQLIAVHFCSCITNQLRYLVFYMDTSDVCTMLSVIWKVSFIFSLNLMWLRILMEVDIIRLLRIVYIFYLVFLAPSWIVKMAMPNPTSGAAPEEMVKQVRSLVS